MLGSLRSGENGCLSQAELMAKPASSIAKGGNMKLKSRNGKNKFALLSYVIIFFFLFQIRFVAIPTVKAETTLTLTKGSWDTIGLDSNKPYAEGPSQFPIQIHVSNSGTETATTYVQLSLGLRVILILILILMSKILNV